MSYRGHWFEITDRGKFIMPENEQDKVFIEIYDATYNNLCKYVVLKCGNAVDVPDIVQNTYMLFYRTLTKKHNIEKPTEYLFKIAKNEINKLITQENRPLVSLVSPSPCVPLVSPGIIVS